MSEGKEIVQQYKTPDGRLVTEYTDGSVEYTLPPTGQSFSSTDFKDELKRAEDRLNKNTQSQKGGGGYTAQRDFPKNINKSLDELERVKAELEQARKDQASLLAQPSGGGKVRLPTEGSKKFVYSGSDPYRSAIDDLYEREAKGDKDAKRLLARMWEQSKQGILDLQKRGISMVACVECGGCLIDGEKVCKSCGFSYLGEDKKGFEVS